MKNWTIIFAMFFITCLFGAGCEEGDLGNGSDTDVDGDTDTDTDGDSDGDTDADADADADADTDSDTDGDADSETEDTDTANEKLIADCQVLANYLNGMISDYDGYVISAQLLVEDTLSKKTCVIFGDFLLSVLVGNGFPFVDPENGTASQENDGSVKMIRNADGMIRSYRK